MFEIVHAGDESQFRRHDVSLPVLCFIGLDCLRFFQALEDTFDGSRQEVFDYFVLIACNVVEVRVFEDSPKEEAPSYPFDAVLAIFNLSSSNLCVDMVWELFEKT